jgi:hypothetical protein
MTRKRSKFDWSLLYRKDLIRFAYLIKDEVCDKRLSIPKFHKILTKHLKSRFPIIVTRKIEKNPITWNDLFIGGTYYSNLDRARKRCIEIVFFYSEMKTITLDKKSYKQICIQIADTLLHEIMHMRQHRRRNFKLLPDYASNAESSSQRKEQGYLGNSDEIDAYSFNIACALIEQFRGNIRKATVYLQKTNKRRIPKANWGLKSYLDAFDQNHKHPIIRRLKQKVIRYLPNAAEGKPYRSKDWINR